MKCSCEWQKHWFGGKLTMLTETFMKNNQFQSRHTRYKVLLFCFFVFLELQIIYKWFINILLNSRRIYQEAQWKQDVILNMWLFLSAWTLLASLSSTDNIVGNPLYHYPSKQTGAIATGAILPHLQTRAFWGRWFHFKLTISPHHSFLSHHSQSQCAFTCKADVTDWTSWQHSAAQRWRTSWLCHS